MIDIVRVSGPVLLHLPYVAALTIVISLSYARHIHP